MSKKIFRPMNNDSRGRLKESFVEILRRFLMVPLILLWSSFSAPFRLLKSVALPSSCRLLRVALLAGMVFSSGCTAWGQNLPTLSTESTRKYYRINVAKNDAGTSYRSTYNVSPTSPYVSVKSAETDEETWYFVDAFDPVPLTITASHLTNYCYIVNAKTGEYLYYTGNNATGSKSNIIVMKARDAADGEADRYKFCIMKSGNTSVQNYKNYVIYPKIIGENNLGSVMNYGHAIWLNGSNSAAVNLSIDKSNEWTRQWTFVSANDPTAKKPVITNASGTITITSNTSGAKIYYTTDGSDPSISNGTLYSSSFSLGNSTTVIKAIAYKSTDDYASLMSTYDVPRCASPEITNTSGTVTITCATAGATIYYTTDGNDPVIGTSLSNPGPLTPGSSATVKAIAVKDGYCKSYISIRKLDVTLSGSGTANDPYLITSDDDFANFAAYFASNPSDAAKFYRINADADIDVSGVAVIIEPFTGTFDGNGQTLTGLTHAIFTTVDGGVVKNVMLKGVAISSSEDTVGAITCKALGYSRIYNCGILPADGTFPEGTHPSVITTGNCAGGLVGSLRGDSRVVNCFSYADVQAANLVAGLVGCNTFASTAAVAEVSSVNKYTNLRTMVVNCMFYGDILGGTNQYPVYGGKKITNSGTNGINSYCWYRYGCTFTAANGHRFSSGSTYQMGEPTDYFCCFPADVRYLTQVEFHRSILNSNRELCGWWVGAASAPSTMDTADVHAVAKDASLMYKWVVDPNIAPYPILKPFGKYPSVVNGNTGTPWVNRATANPYEGRQLGTLKVNVKSGTHSTAADKTVNIPITDMDTLHYDFGYRKAQLPYFNTVFGNPGGADWTAKYAGNYTDYVVTGWKVIGVKDKNGNEFHGKNAFEAHWEHGYNFADRDCTGKDIYDTSGRVFAQGGNYYVPNGVKEITIEAYWGKAIYVRNSEASYDRVNFPSTNTTNTVVGTQFAPAGTRANNVNGQTIQTTTIRGTLTDANIPTKATVYDYALVLVGNVQECVFKNNVTHGTDNTRGFTIMSVDLDFDEEPDYCLEWQLGYSTTRQQISPVRFDFLPVVEMGIAAKLDGSTYFLSLGCFRPLGHFEVTETAFIRFGQFEYEYQTRDDGPIILNGGIFDQYTRGKNNDSKGNHITYTILGGHLVLPSFTPGSHAQALADVRTTRHNAVSVLGGDYTSLYLTGGYYEGVTPFQDNPHCYIDGGRFGNIASAYKEGIWGDVIWRINHALIGEFYGGGMMSQSSGTKYQIVKGSIDVVIDSSIVRKYCGGPKFGDMVAGKTVTTRATGTIFTEYYGAGNGGTNYVQDTVIDRGDVQDPDGYWYSGIGNIKNQYTPELYRSWKDRYQANYEMELINVSSGTDAGKAVCRTYFFSAQFATTNTGTVTNTLTGCTILNNYYGAGFLGGVNGNVTSTLTDTRVYGSAFGAGYSASIPKVTFYNKFKPGTAESAANLDKSIPHINFYTGMVVPPGEGTGNTYTWSSSGSTGTPVTDDTNFYTSVPLSNLGAVKGNVTLTLKGNTMVGTQLSGGVLKANTGNVYGGGDQSAVTPSIVNNNPVTNTGNTIVNLQDGVSVLGNVYGGGNRGAVAGNSSVTIQDPQP